MKLQIALALAVLCFAIVVVPPGSAGLLIALGDPAPARWATRQGATLLQAGAVRDSVVIRVPDGRTQWQALRDGLLLIPASMPGCASSSGKAY